MRADRAALVALSLLTLVVFAGCPRQVPPEPAPSVPPELPSVPRPAPSGEPLEAGDVIVVTVEAEEDLSDTWRLAADGSITYPLLGVLDLAGLTSNEVAWTLRQGLADGYVQDPRVSVLVKERAARRVLVLGEVRAPGYYAFSEDMRAVEALDEAKGPTPWAAPGRVTVTRRVDGAEQVFEVSLAPPYGEGPGFALSPGDVVTVPEEADRQAGPVRAGASP